MDKACSQCGEKGHDLRNCTSDITFACTCDVKTPHANAVGCKKLALYVGQRPNWLVRQPLSKDVFYVARAMRP